MYIAIDIGGTNTRVLALKSLDDISFSQLDIFPTAQEYEQGIKNISNSILKSTQSPIAISCGIAGGVNQDRGAMSSTHALIPWLDKPFVHDLFSLFNCLVYLRNDGVMGALGEAYFGQHDFEHFMYITWGTGVGSGLIETHDKKISAHRPLDRSLVHHLEAHIGGRTGAIKYKKPLAKLNEEEWQEVMDILKDGLLELSKSDTWDTPSNFVFGGGVSEKQQDRITALKLPDPLSISISQLQEKSGLYGAIAVLQQMSH